MIKFPDTRGFRNNNPGNIRKSNSQWLGASKTQLDKDFVQFYHLSYGIRALAKLLLTYYTKRFCLTISDLISRYAPPKENETEAYIKVVSARAEVNSKLVLGSPQRQANIETWSRIISAIICQENGCFEHFDFFRYYSLITLYQYIIVDYD